MFKWLAIIAGTLRSTLRRQRDLAAENLVLRQLTIGKSPTKSMRTNLWEAHIENMTKLNNMTPDTMRTGSWKGPLSN